MKAVWTVVAVVAIASVAWADATNVRPVVPGATGDAQTLQQVFNSITVSGPAINAVTDQDPYALFTNGATGGSVATFIIELSGNASGNSFGIYTAGNAANKAQIFSGTDGSGDIALVVFYANGDVKVNGTVVANAFGPNFGFYLDNGSSVFYSEDSLNGGTAHALIYEGNAQTTLQLPGVNPGLWSPNEFIIAFEDGLGAYTSDFNDLVVMVESIVPVPAPAAVLLGVMGLGAVGAVRRRFA